MTEYLAEFQLQCEGRISAEGETIIDPRGRFRLQLMNDLSSTDSKCQILAAHLYFTANSLHESKQIAIDMVVEAINCVAFVSNSCIRFEALKRIVDWSVGPIRRPALIFMTSSTSDFENPRQIATELITSATKLLELDQDGPLHSILRWYRLGIQAQGVEEQFSYFWFALEIAAECVKDTEKVPHKCMSCQEPLFCQACQTIPTHRKFAKDAIQNLIKVYSPDGADEISKTLFKIRNTLQHGRRIESIESELPCKIEQAVNKLANITWNSILAVMRLEQQSLVVHCIHAPPTFVKYGLTASVKMEFSTPTGTPSLGALPDINISMVS